MSSSTAEQQYDAVYLSPIGWLGIRLQGQQLKQLAWLSARPVVKKVENRRLRIIMDALHRYFSAAQDFPTLPVAPEGTVFQRRVWAALQDIPCGQAVTYGQLARKLNTGSRAIGQACRANPIAVIIPCHRVIAARGPGGYMGKAGKTVIKQWLLAHEGHD
ncbi:MAG: hypothetical protein A2W28_01825 [Gammaproteobacteria bacterium RBG_16_51_14]|nr:MAG: hypothetical protein A2W28_01825 [Gammaproteobacteria bacterium RBG_16_51_14]